MKKTAPKNFEDALAQLETITEAMQRNDLPLEEALAAYQRGQKLQVLDGDNLKELQLDGHE